ncbi:MAG TPA: septum formation initiator family protein [Bacillota bacterium]|nr:septum formation initiator family protein [Bacillota bacterium]
MGSVKTNIFVRLAVVAVVLFFIITVIDLRSQLNSLKDEKERLETTVIKLNDNIEEINAELDTPLTDEYIEKIARELYDYRDADEIIFYNDTAN